MQSFIITATSAAQTLQILDRQARRDTGKVIRFTYRAYRVLSSPQAIATYRTLWACLQLACMVAIALGASAREWCDAYVESCLEQSTAVEQAPEPRMVDTVVPFKRRDRHPAWEGMDSFQLRRECQQRGIKWRNAAPNGKHLSKPVMVRLLASA